MSRQEKHMDTKKTFKEYLYPTQRSLKKGCIHDIYIESESGTMIYEGKARLIEPCISWRKPLPYVKFESRDKEDSNTITINWITSRWVVYFISGKMKGHSTCRNIHYFYSIGDQVSNIYDEDDEEEE